ncbi:MAG: hypothetical protein K9N55_19370 [Phycisphaerae bacterium]|nr:hypothetical protein [Phycisphaerae bacterium]
MAHVGYSDRINDPAFARYLANQKRYAWIFAWIMAAAFTGGFFYYGTTGKDMTNPQALYIGLGLGCMMLAIAFLTNLRRTHSRTWDGEVIDRKVQKKRRHRNQDDNDGYIEEYLLYTVIIREDNGRKHNLVVKNDATLYNYFQNGDKVRRHGKLNTYEKYDKSKDTVIFCNACASRHEIADDVCSRCKCPLLK